jgi:Holliday junction resolvasome RuvABC ATP-dependent DNA helicase subunit
MARPPKTLASFIGQARVVSTLKQLVDGSRANGHPVPTILLVAPAGLGKTSLALALARYAASQEDHVQPTNLHVVHAGRGAILHLHRVLKAAKDGDFVFVDEAHALAQQDAELLYLAMDGARTLHLGDDGRLDRTVFETIASVTIVFATNIPGRMPKALQSRSITLELDRYSQRELRAIVQKVAADHELDITPQACGVIADRANGTPRRIEHMLTLVGALVTRGTRVTQGQVENALATMLGHDGQGLTPMQRQLLELLDKGPMRAEQVANHLGLDGAYIRAEVEGPLVARGLISVTGNHMRQLTPEGRANSTFTTDEQNQKTGESEHTAATGADEVEAADAALSDDPKNEGESPTESLKENPGAVAGNGSPKPANVPASVAEQIARLKPKRLRTLAT